MELKYIRGHREAEEALRVLIVPLWNWNATKNYGNISESGFNRTFMELKFMRSCSSRLASFRFNRTFMELKSASSQDHTGRAGVLIVPLWNWNSDWHRQVPPPDEVLIVPLWNWNRCIRTSMRSATRFNRTFMELKWCSSRRSMNGRSVLIVPLWNWNSHPLSFSPHLFGF